jgi:hypothetical protein
MDRLMSAKIAKRPKLQPGRRRFVVAARFFRDVINPQPNCAIKRFIGLHLWPFCDGVAFAKSPCPDFFGRLSLAIQLWVGRFDPGDKNQP